jgi:hypothetical protein
MPRLTASSASSRGVQVLTGRSAASGFSHGSRHKLHELLEGEGGGRSRALLSGQEHFDGLTQAFRLASGFDDLQPRLGCVPAIPPAPHGFIIDLPLVSNRGVAGPLGCCSDDVSALDQSLLALGAVDHTLQKLLLDGAQMNRTRLLGGHESSLLLVLPCILS